MALTPGTVGRDNEATGQDFLIFLDGSSRRIQSFAVVDENGAHAGIAGTPLVTSVSGTVTANAPVGTSYSSGGTAVDSAVIKASAGVLRELRCILDPSAVVTRYLMLFNATSLPANGTAPVWRMLVPAGGEASESFSLGLNFTTGITAALSSTATILTLAGAEGFVHAITE